MMLPTQYSEPWAAGPDDPGTESPQMASLKRRYRVTTKRALLRAIADEYTRETGEKYTLRDADLILDGMLEAEYQRIEGGAYW